MLLKYENKHVFLSNRKILSKRFYPIARCVNSYNNKRHLKVFFGNQTVKTVFLITSQDRLSLSLKSKIILMLIFKDAILENENVAIRTLTSWNSKLA